MSPLTRRISLPPPSGEMESFTPEGSANMRELIEQPARNEEELRGHQRQRNDIAAAQPPRGDLSLEEEEKPKELDFSRINELSQSYEDHLGNLPQREDQGLKRKLLSILLGYGASLGGGVGHGLQVGKQFYDQPYHEKVADWGIREQGIGNLADTELSRLGEEGDFLDDSQGNLLELLKFRMGREDKNREFGLKTDQFDFEQEQADVDTDLNNRKLESIDSSRDNTSQNYRDRTEALGNRPEGVPNTIKNEQNVLRRILIQNPELDSVIKMDQDGNYFIPKIDGPEGSWWGGDPSEDELFNHDTKSQLRDRAQRMLREGLGIEGEEEEEEDDLLQRLLDQGLLEPI